MQFVLQWGDDWWGNLCDSSGQCNHPVTLSRGPVWFPAPRVYCHHAGYLESASACFLTAPPNCSKNVELGAVDHWGFVVVFFSFFSFLILNIQSANINTTGEKQSSRAAKYLLFRTGNGSPSSFHSSVALGSLNNMRSWRTNLLHTHTQIHFIRYFKSWSCNRYKWQHMHNCHDLKGTLHSQSVLTFMLQQCYKSIGLDVNYTVPQFAKGQKPTFWVANDIICLLLTISQSVKICSTVLFRTGQFSDKQVF